MSHRGWAKSSRSFEVEVDHYLSIVCFLLLRFDLSLDIFTCASMMNHNDDED